MLRAHPEITLNQRLWHRQKHRTSVCKYCKRMKIVFLKNIHGQFIACEATKVVEKEDGRKILDEQGIISKMGRRVGWAVHDCSAKPGAVPVIEPEVEYVPLPEYEPVDASEQLSVNSYQ